MFQIVLFFVEFDLWNKNDFMIADLIDLYYSNID